MFTNYDKAIAGLLTPLAIGALTAWLGLSTEAATSIVVPVVSVIATAVATSLSVFFIPNKKA